MLDPNLIQLIASVGPRVGKPPHQYTTKQELAEALQREQVNEAYAVDACWDLAHGLGLSDVTLGSDIVIRAQPIDGSIVFVPQLTSEAYIRLAVRTGLYLPSRTWVDADRANPENRHFWIANATCRARYERTDSTWVDVGAQARYDEWFERDADRASPTREWQFNAPAMLQEVASCLAAQLALTPLLDDVPCECLIAGFAEDINLQNEIVAWDAARAKR